MSSDLYDVLGVSATASEAEIRHAFWALARKYHPDVNGGDPDAARRFVEVGSAAETLLDPGRRATYDISRVPTAPARRPDVAPKPPPPPSTTPPPGRPTSAAPASTGRDAGRFSGMILLAAIVAGVGWAVLAPRSPSPRYNSPDTSNGTVVWKAAGFALADGWGINLAGNGMRIQIVPGTSTDIEVTGGDVASAGHIALLPRGEAPTYQHCVSAVRQATSQSEPLSAIAPASRSLLCVSGSGGDLASVQVTRDNGSSITANITVWEDV